MQTTKWLPFLSEVGFQELFVENASQSLDESRKFVHSNREFTRLATSQLF
jgi:hypothetical protein